MKKVHLISILFIIILFIFTALLKFAPFSEDPGTGLTSDGLDEKATLRMFWEEYNRASAHLIATQYDSAAIYYEKALKLNSDHEGALYNLGNSYLFLKKFEEAEKQWLKLAGINPLSARARLQLGTLYFCMVKENRQFNPALAETYFRQAHLLNREETGSQLKLAKIAILTDQLSKSEELLNVVLSVNFLSYQALFLNGYLEWQEGEIDSATESLKEAIELYQNLNTTIVQGEGKTRKGSQAMLSEDRFCDLFEFEINQILKDPEILTSEPEHIYQDFRQTLHSWQNNTPFTESDS